MKRKARILYALLGVGFSLSAGVAAAQAPDPTQTEERVRTVFADAPVMVEVARCESQFRLYTATGTPLRGGYESDMIGVFQIYEAVHADRADTLGHDITTRAGNVAYARHLYDRSGTTPWDASQSCWKEAVDATDSARPPRGQTMTDAERQERIGLLQQIISLLQTILDLRRAQ